MSETSTEYTPFQLPSRGVLYRDSEGNDPIPEGKVEIRKMTGQEMERLIEAGASAWNRVNQITDQCTRMPNQFPPGQLLVTDRLALLIGMRIITHGPSYTFEYRCQSCNSTVKDTVNLVEELDERTPEDVERRMHNEFGRPDFEFAEPLSLRLPDCGRTVYLRFLRGDDQEMVMKREKRAKMEKTGGSQYTYRLALHIMRIDESGADLHVAQREDFVRSLTAGDQTHLQNFLDEAETGIDLTIFPDCSSCGATNELYLPFGTEFFRPRSRSFG